MNSTTENNCVSIFKDGRSKPDPEHFTKAWITLINGIGQNKKPASMHK
ncbi:MAG: hypothetical protein IJC39_02615 [Firmicutes bacterium]|nr:hypothetical protein [Bacillota bacterium]